uniref:NADH-ubiquinone oxidoreductase chain 4L n=1 Tax=Mezira sp. TaxID=2931906 RepID=A0A8T9VU95_9HEMI|nr:NADH dehydrogenase subunit 4L [Mezira sp.]
MLSMLMLISSLVAFVLNKRHVLLALIALEYAVLLQVYCITCLGTQNDFICYIMIIYLAFAVGEGALGLAIIAYMTRNHGNDYVSSIFPLW